MLRTTCYLLALLLMSSVAVAADKPAADKDAVARIAPTQRARASRWSITTRTSRAA